MRIALLGAFLALPFLASAAPDTKPLVIHEWGTFTSLQNESGETIGGVNVDDEPVPKFVHHLGEPKPGESVWDRFEGKSLYPGAPSVTMRLETPVMYFYPPDNKPITLDVTATFKGGLVSEYFPNGETFMNGKANRRSPETVPASTIGAITWKNVTINATGEPPRTDEHVWVAPRKVASAPIKIGNEAEQYIFYRGVGNLNAPLKVVREGERIRVHPDTFSFTPRWFAEFRADGTAAYYRMTDQRRDESTQQPAYPATFADSEFKTENVADLRKSMRDSLMAAGLFEDEAEAMLETWKLSYFKSAGQRLFYLVPQTWTDTVLPLQISRPAQVTRVMMGRIELVTPQQRAVVNEVTELIKQPKRDAAKEKELTAKLGRFGQSLVNDNYRRQQEAHAAAAAAAAKEPVAAAAK